MKRNDSEIKRLVRLGYAKIVKQRTSCCCTDAKQSIRNFSKSIGYSEVDMKSIPKNANLGLGCGNPIAIAELKQGNVVLDLGSGAGFDVFLAAGRVGKTGHVIGVDMTPEMIQKAKNNARKGHFTNVEFRLGEIEKLPVEDNGIDVVISNCVINLSPDKKAVFREAFRVLKPGGCLMVSDLVLEKNLPKIIRNSTEAYVGCLAGAILKSDYLKFLRNAGFRNVRIVAQDDYPVDVASGGIAAQIGANNPKVSRQNIKNLKGYVTSIKVQAVKPLKNK